MEKKFIHAFVKICCFFLIANLPFLTITHLFGIETFIDSYKYPCSYEYIKNDTLHTLNTSQGYILLEKPSHEGYSINKGDTILYLTKTETALQQVAYATTTENGCKMYYLMTNNRDTIHGPIYDHQILGKIIGRFDDTIWNTLCIQIWDLSVDNLNAIALFSDF